jgi:hypothetical protein
MSYRYLPTCIIIIVLLVTGCAPSVTVSQRKCVPISKIYEKGTGIAVWDFEIIRPEDDDVHDSVHKDRFLANRIRKNINKEEHFNLVGRDRLYLALQELNLGTNAVTDERTRRRLGEITGTKLMVFGEVRYIGNIMFIRLDLKDVETGLSPSTVNKHFDPALSSMSELKKAVEDMTPELLIICQ